MQKNIVSFSGGKDSTAMLLMMIEKGFKIDRIINIDTTYEFPEMYRHIEKVKDYIKEYGFKIETVKIDFDYWFYKHIKTKGKNKGKKGYSWPDFRNRWCTALKREAFIRTVCSNETFNPRKRGIGKKDKNIVEYHGISFDEKESRINKNKDGRNIKHPLIEWEMVGKDCIEYCYSKGFDWGGLYEKMSRVSCWCCPLSRIGELKILYTDFPDLWQELKELDKKSFRQFRSDYSVEELELKFKKDFLKNHKRPVGRPQKANKKSKPFSIRFSQNNLKILNQLAVDINISKSEILERSFDFYKNSGNLN